MNLELLKEERIKNGYTQQYMANKLGFRARSSYCQIEKGIVSVSVETAHKIASILNLSDKKMFEIFLLIMFKLYQLLFNNIILGGKNKCQESAKRAVIIPFI